MPPIKTIRIRNHYFGPFTIHTYSITYLQILPYKYDHYNIKRGEQEKLLLTLLGSYYTNTYKL